MRVVTFSFASVQKCTCSNTQAITRREITTATHFHFFAFSPNYAGSCFWRIHRCRLCLSDDEQLQYPLPPSRISAIVPPPEAKEATTGNQRPNVKANNLLSLSLSLSLLFLPEAKPSGHRTVRVVVLVVVGRSSLSEHSIVV